MGVLDGKVVVVTGGGRGLGEAYSIHAAQSGASVIVNDIDAKEADDVAQKIRAAGGRAAANGSSIADWKGAEALISSAVETYGQIDGLVNNAGLFYVSEPWEDEETRIRGLIEVNVLGTLFCGILAMRQMVAQGKGSIVNVTSGAHVGLAQMGTYGASKGAVASATYSWAMDAMPHNVKVNAISPIAATRMALSLGPSRSSSAPTWLPEHTAPLVTFLLSDLSEGITGQVIRLSGRQLSLMRHPGVIPPVEEADAWTVDSIHEAFQRSLRTNLQAVGLGNDEYTWSPNPRAGTK